MPIYGERERERVLSKDKEDIKGNCIKKSATFKISIRKPGM